MSSYGIAIRSMYQSLAPVMSVISPTRLARCRMRQAPGEERETVTDAMLRMLGGAGAARVRGRPCGWTRDVHPEHFLDIHAWSSRAGPNARGLNQIHHNVIAMGIR